MTYKASRTPFGAKAEQGYILGRENVAARDMGDRLRDVLFILTNRKTLQLRIHLENVLQVSQYCVYRTSQRKCVSCLTKLGSLQCTTLWLALFTHEYGKISNRSRWTLSVVCINI